MTRRTSQILALVAEEFSTTPDDILSVRRFSRIVFARAVAMWLVRNSEDGPARYSLPELEREFGRNDSTILHAIRKIDRLLAEQPKSFDAQRVRVLLTVAREGRYAPAAEGAAE